VRTLKGTQVDVVFTPAKVSLNCERVMIGADERV